MIAKSSFDCFLIYLEVCFKLKGVCLNYMY